MEELNRIVKWMWMIDYCKKMLWNPHDADFWNKAEKEYYKQQSK